MSRADLPPGDSEFFSGDSKLITFNVQGVTLTGYNVTFAVYKGSTEVLRKTTGGGVTVVANSFSVAFTPGDTVAFTGSFKYEAEGRGPGGEVVTLAYGSLKILPDLLAGA